MIIFNLLRKKKKLAEPWAKYYTKEQLNKKIPGN